MISTIDTQNRECSRTQSHTSSSSLFSAPRCSWDGDVGVKVRRSLEFVCKSSATSSGCPIKKKSPPRARHGTYGACWLLLKSLICACHSIISSLPLQGSCGKRLKPRKPLGLSVGMAEKWGMMPGNRVRRKAPPEK